jgi:hypothetical protein
MTIVETPAEAASVLKHRKQGLREEERNQLLGREGSSGAEDALDHQQKLQDQLSEDLQKRAALLKNNTNLFQDLLQKDKDVLQKTETEMEKNALRLQKERGRIAQLTSSSWTLTLLIWGSVLLVVLMFMGTFIFMRTFKPRRSLASVQGTSTERGFLWRTTSIGSLKPTPTMTHQAQDVHEHQDNHHHRHDKAHNDHQVFEEGWLW